MRSQKTSLCAAKIVNYGAALALSVGVFSLSSNAWAQADQYQAKKAKPAIAADAQPATGTKKTGAAAAAPTEVAKPADAPAGDKLDIKDLEQKYWAPKDTDFSVVQNRTYSKTKRWAASGLFGPIVNDPFSTGFNYSGSVNYYFDERQGIEFMYIKNDLSDSKNTSAFKHLSGGGTLPDFNRDTSFYGVAYNWVPFYAKMSFLGQKIIYFDMQISPLVGIAGYDQMTANGPRPQTAFAYGYDVTQYFFFSNNFAVRANIHNHYYSEKVVSYGNTLVPAGTSLRTDTADTTVFLLGITYFFGN